MPKKTSGAERAQRLMALLGHLAPDAKLRVADLAEELGTTEAQLTADLETLSVCGVAPYYPDTLVPIFVEDGVVEVWGELPAVRGPIRLSSTEAGALAAALQAAGFPATDPLTSRLVEAAASAAFDADVLAATLQAASTGHDAEIFELLSLAASRHTVVAIDYVKAGSEEITHREIEPVRLFLERGAWYLVAWCRLAGDWRTFRVDRVRGAQPTRETFPERLVGAVPGGAFTSANLPKARLCFASPDDYAEREWPGAIVAPSEPATGDAATSTPCFGDEASSDGLTVDVPYAGTDWIARQVVARLGAVKVLTPTQIADAVAALTREELAKLDG